MSDRLVMLAEVHYETAYLHWQYTPRWRLVARWHRKREWKTWLNALTDEVRRTYKPTAQYDGEVRP